MSLRRVIVAWFCNITAKRLSPSHHQRLYVSDDSAKPGRVRLARGVSPWLLPTAATAAATALLTRRDRRWALAAVPLSALTGAMLWFFRDPDRTPGRGPDPVARRRRGAEHRSMAGRPHPGRDLHEPAERARQPGPPCGKCHLRAACARWVPAGVQQGQRPERARGVAFRDRARRHRDGADRGRGRAPDRAVRERGSEGRAGPSGSGSSGSARGSTSTFPKGSLPRCPWARRRLRG